MNISKILAQEFNENHSYHQKILNDQIQNGIIASGFVKKNMRQDSQIDITVEEYHGLLILSGEGIYKDKHHEIPIKPGDFVQRQPGVTHSTIIKSDDWVELYLVMGQSLYKELLQLNVLTNVCPVLKVGVTYEMVAQFIEIHKRIGRSPQYEAPLIIPLMIAYLAKIHYRSQMKETKTDDQQLLIRATDYINAHIKERITVAEVSEYVHMGYERFRKIFTSKFGISPGNYIIQQRIIEAQKCLSNGKLSINEIAIYLGYVDTYTFSKQFKRYTGRSPRDFKRLFLR